MNPDVKTQWVAALRSGDYDQGRGGLNPAPGKWCCLGVLCDLAAKAGVVNAAHVNSPFVETRYDGHDAYLPDSVANWAGLDDHNPRVAYDIDIAEYTEHTPALSTLNDRGIRFTDIADLIQEQL